MATIEFKNIETQQFFKTVIEEAERKDRIFAQKCQRVLVLQKAGLCSQPIGEA